MPNEIRPPQNFPTRLHCFNRHTVGGAAIHNHYKCFGSMATSQIGAEARLKKGKSSHPQHGFQTSEVQVMVKLCTTLGK